MNKLEIKGRKPAWHLSSTNDRVAFIRVVDLNAGGSFAGFSSSEYFVRATRRVPKTSIAFKNKDYV